MSKKTYAEKLLDPRWQKRRLEALSLSNFSCECCFDGTKTLHVHHKHYIKDREVWEYEDSQLAVLCHECHKLQHNRKERFEDLIARLPLDGPGNIDEIYCLVAGFIKHSVSLSDSYEIDMYNIGLVVRNLVETSK